MVPKLITSRDLECEKYLNPVGGEYGKTTQFVSLDTEYDADMESNLKAPCKVSIVNDKGEIILDTLISQLDEQGERRKLKREVWIHGINSIDIDDAPTFSEVRKHICSVLDPATTVIVGHSIK